MKEDPWNPQYKENPLSNRQIFLFVLIQLYPNWRRILRKLSSGSEQFKVVFGLQTQNKPWISSLFNSPNIKRQSNKNYRRVIAIGSPVFDFFELSKHQLLKRLENFDNGFLKIRNISIEVLNDYEEMTIEYSFREEEDKKKIFELHRIRQFSREGIQKFTRKDERLSCIVVSIPMYAKKDELNKYKEVYDCLKTFK